MKKVIDFDRQKNFLANSFLMFLVGGIFVFFSFNITFDGSGFEFLPDCLGYAAFVVAFVYLLLAREVFDSVYGLFFQLFSFFMLVFLVDYVFGIIGFIPTVVWWDSFATFGAYFGAFSLAFLGYGVAEKFTPYLKKYWVGVILIYILLLLLTFVLLDMALDNLNQLFSFGDDWLFLSLFFVLVPLWVCFTFGITAKEIKTAKNKSYKVLLAIVLVGYITAQVFQWFSVQTLNRKNDLAACEMNQNVGAKDLCYFGLGGKYGLLEDCDRIQQIFQRDSCYALIGQEGKDESICAKINTQNLRDGCYLNVAWNSRKVTLCKNIQDSQTLSNCEQNF